MIIKRYPLEAVHDFHVHLCRGEMLKLVAPETARLFSLALVMPNTDPPILTAADANEYRREILEVCKEYPSFSPLMTIKLTPATEAKDLIAGKITEIVTAGKFYPEGVTNNSQDGFGKLSDAAHLLAIMQDYDLPLSIHAERPGADPLTAEQQFLEEILWAANTFPKLKIIVEHLSSFEAVGLVMSLPANVAGTITAHHLVLTNKEANENPHCYCKPVAKTETDRAALIGAAISGNPKFFFGSDSTPHPRLAKERANPVAGCFSAPVALQILAEIFEKEGAITKLNDFVGKFGADFYGMEIKTRCVSLSPIPHGSLRTLGEVVPFTSGTILHWQAEPCIK